jgi:hypothetical protein
MLRTGWHEFFSDRPLDLIVAASVLPSKSPSPPHYSLFLSNGAEMQLSTSHIEARLRQIVDLMDGVVERCNRTLIATPTTIRAWVLSYNSNRLYGKPLKQLQDQESLHRYVGYWKRFLAYVYRVWALRLWASAEQQARAEQEYGLHISAAEHRLLLNV